MSVILIEPMAGSFVRTIELDRGSLDSEIVFLETARPSGVEGVERHTFALDRAEFLDAIKREFGLVDPIEAALEL